MAFTGTAVVTQTTDRKVRITGLSLAADATGTIGLAGDTGAGVQLPAPFTEYAKPTKYDGAAVGLADSIECRQQAAADAGAAACPISISKGGTPFRISVHNDLAGGGAASPNLEFYVEYL